MNILKQKFVILLFVLTALFSVNLIPSVAHARGLVPCGGYSDDQGTREPACTVLDMFGLVARVTNWLIAVSGVYAVYQIAFNSFSLVYSMGNEEAITKHKSAITSAIVGMVMALMAFMFVNTAVNLILLGGIGYKPGYENCKFNLSDPLTYLTIKAEDSAMCHKQ